MIIFNISPTGNQFNYSGVNIMISGIYSLVEDIGFCGYLGV